LGQGYYLPPGPIGGAIPIRHHLPLIKSPFIPFFKEGISISPPFIKGRRGGIGFEITFLFWKAFKYI